MHISGIMDLFKALYFSLRSWYQGSGSKSVGWAPLGGHRAHAGGRGQPG